ncbi:SAP domain-containing protein [Halobacillus litoralis]|uniref:SAP domain-containing protein n=1 Tax=Halobacillus litoralis TaxID=45668 RepID=UPI00136A1A25|nr:SAP domain-containing protein [Halobacillus litoralis]MYL38743.1 hypothetical protein [Halobacillus litoralis]
MGLFDLLKKALKGTTPPKPIEGSETSLRAEPAYAVRKSYNSETNQYDNEKCQNEPVPTKELSKKNQIFESHVDRNLKGIELERDGNVDAAISLYELNIAERFEGNHPYDSLANLYRERKQYDEEMRVLLQAVDVFGELEVSSPRQDVSPKLQRFRERLEQTKDRKELSAIKLSNGLLSGEVILIDWISGKHRNVFFPRYYSETYGIDAERSLEKLFKEGYVTEGSPLYSLEALTVPKLKELLKSKQLKVGGKKADLIARITEKFSEAEVEAIVGDNPVMLITAKGEATLKAFYYIVPAHRRPSSDGSYNVASAIRHVAKYDYNPLNADISFALIGMSIEKHARNRKYGLMRNSIRSMAEQLEREKRYDNALFHYLRVFISETSGMGNGNRVSLVRNLLIDGFPSYKNVERLVLRLDVDEEEFRNMFVDTWERTRGELPYHYLDANECYHCFFHASLGNAEELEMLYSNAYRRLQDEYNDESFYEMFRVHIPYDHAERFG